MGNTIIDLVDDLKEKLKGEQVESRAATVRKIIAAAEEGYYHDFLTPVATPKMNLYYLLSDIGYKDIANKVKDGAYDNEKPTDYIQEFKN